MKIDSSSTSASDHVDDGEKKREKMAVKENTDEIVKENTNQDDSESAAGGNTKKKAVENQEIPPILLFEKTLESEDSNAVLNRLVVGRCKELMMTTLQNAEEAKKLCDYVRVMTKDPEGVEYELRFMRYTPKGKYVLTHKWGDLVAANGLGKGDIIVGWGNLVGDAFFVMLRFLRRSQQIIDVYLSSSDSSR